MAEPTSLYPLATQDAQSIPLDIIKPTSLVKRNITTSASSLTLSSAFRFSTFFSSVDCWIDLLNDGTAVPADGVEKIGWLYVPADYLVTAEITPGPIRAFSADIDSSPGRLVIQGFVRWDALSLPVQYSRKTS